METEPQITFLGMDPSSAIEKRIHDRISKLEEFHGRIISCRTTVSAPHRHRHKGRIYAVTVDVGVPGGEIVVNKEPGRDHAHEDIYVVIRDAFNAVQRQLEDHVRKQSGFRVKEHAGKTHGEVVRLFSDESYGFIKALDGREFFFQRDNVTGDGWSAIDLGSTVHFSEMEGEQGLHAVSVTVAA